MTVTRVKDAFLTDVDLSDLKRMVRKERPGKSRDRLLAAIMRKEGKSQQYIAEHLGRAQSTISAWLNRMQNEGLEGRYDRKKPGRPSRLSAERQKDVSAALKEEPFKSGFERGIGQHSYLCCT